MRHARAVACATMLTPLLGACGRRGATPIAATAVVPSMEQGVVGDSALGVRVLAIDQRRGVARVALAQPAYLMAFDVLPGRYVGLLSTSTRMAEPGERDVRLAASGTASAVCTGGDGMVHMAPRTATRDSKGRVTESVDQIAVSSGTRCGLPAPSKAAVRTRGYLLVLASPTPRTAQAIDAQVRRLAVKADDVRGTMDGIGDGLFVDSGTAWAGHYVRW